MEKKFTNMERRGLPGGPNEVFSYITGVFSTEGYKKDSPDINNLFNIIDSSDISMKDVEFPVMGYDELGNSQLMMPGGEYKFPGNQVLEIPMAQNGNGEFRDFKGIPFLSSIAAGDFLNNQHYNSKLADLYRYYSGTPLEDNILQVSNTKPAKSKDSDVKYISLNKNQQLVQEVIDNYNRVSDGNFYTTETRPDLILDASDNERQLDKNNYKVTGYREVDNIDDYQLNAIGNYITGFGEDEKGAYISYYDKFDQAGGLGGSINIGEQLGLTKPFEIYDRIYVEKDKDSGKYIQKQNGGDVIAPGDGYEYVEDNGKYYTRKKGSKNWTEAKGKALANIKYKIYNIGDDPISQSEKDAKVIERMRSILPDINNLGFGDEGYWSGEFEDMSPEMQQIVSYGNSLGNGAIDHDPNSPEGKAFEKYARRIASPEAWMRLYPETMGKIFDPNNDPDKFKSIKKEWGKASPKDVELSQMDATSFSLGSEEQMIDAGKDYEAQENYFDEINEASTQAQYKRDEEYRIAQEAQELEDGVDRFGNPIPQWKLAGYDNPDDYYNYLQEGDLDPIIDAVEPYITPILESPIQNLNPFNTSSDRGFKGYVSDILNFVPDYSNEESRDAALLRARQEGLPSIKYKGERYSTATDMRPGQEAQAMGMDIEGKHPVVVNYYPVGTEGMFPSHIEAYSLDDPNLQINPWPTDTDKPIFDTDNYRNRRISNQDQDRQSKTIYLTDDEFDHFKKVTGEYKGKNFVEGELTPDRYDFYAQNCAKGVCQALNIGPRKGTSWLHDATLPFQNMAYGIGASDMSAREVLTQPNLVFSEIDDQFKGRVQNTTGRAGQTGRDGNYVKSQLKDGKGTVWKPYTDPAFAVLNAENLVGDKHTAYVQKGLDEIFQSNDVLKNDPETKKLYNKFKSSSFKDGKWDATYGQEGSDTRNLRNRILQLNKEGKINLEIDPEIKSDFNMYNRTDTPGETLLNAAGDAIYSGLTDQRKGGELEKVLQQSISNIENSDNTLMKKHEGIQRLVDAYNSMVPDKFKKGGPVLSDNVKLYQMYINGDKENSKAKEVYDKLNRVYYNKAKEKGMSPQNYIMSYVIGTS
jgi:hypothetical protein